MFKTTCFNTACFVRKSVAAKTNPNVCGEGNSLKLFDISFLQYRQTALLDGIFRIPIFPVGTTRISEKYVFLDLYDV